MHSEPPRQPDPRDKDMLYERFVSLFVAHETRLRGFLRSLLPQWDAIDDVMQETSLVAWRKFERFEQGTNFMAWVVSIARFEALRYLRTRRRDRLVFSDEVFDLIADDGLEELDSLDREREALGRCILKLPTAQRELLQLAYQPGVKFHEVAERSGKSVQGFYKTIQRLRGRLSECIRGELEGKSV